MDIKQILIALAVAALLIFGFRTCQRTKKMEIKQKSNQDKSSLSIEVEKQKLEE